MELTASDVGQYCLVSQLVNIKDLPLAKKPKMLDQEHKIVKSETRRGSKPLVEKKRRARINHSLAELQALVISKTRKEGYKHNRIEKADILEMTVRYLKKVQTEQKYEKPYSKFRDGYLECLSEVSRYLTTTERLDSSLNERLQTHIIKILEGSQQETAQDESSMDEEVSSCSDSKTSPVVSSTTTSPSTSPSPSQMSTTDHTNIVVTGHPISSTGLPESLAGVRVIPSRLPSGQLAFVVPTNDYYQYMGRFSATASRPSPEPVRERCALMMDSCNTSSSSPGYLSREGEGRNPDILCKKAMCPSGGKNALQKEFGSMWRPW